MNEWMKELKSILKYKILKKFSTQTKYNKGCWER